MSRSTAAKTPASLPPVTAGAGNEAGERVLALAVHMAQQLWRDRLLSAYAIGSLAHGGFSAHVSDVDLALVLEHPLDDEDALNVRRICEQLVASGTPLGERLSLFWGSTATMADSAAGGRFPPADLLDLHRHGRLLAGSDLRSEVSLPSLRDLIVAGAEFAYRILTRPEATAYLADPEKLARAPVRTLTKLTLYPVRFLYTARTGNVGINHEAVSDLVASMRGPAAELALESLQWRYTPPPPGDRGLVALLQRGICPLYSAFIEDYQARLSGYGEVELAHVYRDWIRQFSMV
jgi:hypothetical protein